jgi:OmpA-OmpF porin, OOP family
VISKGIDGSRLIAIGHGDERPIAPNDTDEGRQKNRRIEATEL